MSIFKVFDLKNAPSLEREFIQDPAELLIEEGRAGKTGRLPLEVDEKASEEFSHRVREEWEKNPSNPGSASYMPLLLDE